MIKSITGLVLLLAFIIQTFSTSFIVLDYFANTASYAKNCENKAKPKLHCNGKCQMMKKLKQEESKDKQNPNRRAENKNQTLFFSQLQTNINFYNTVIPSKFFFFDNNTTKDIPSCFFHPPCA